MIANSVNVLLPIQWGDMDALGHVNNARFFTWFESARIALFERIGVASKQPLTVGPILATTTCTFLSPAHFPGSVEVRASISRVGETSVTMDYEVRSATSPEVVYARGSSVVVMVDYRSMAKVRVPDDVRAAINALGASG